MAWVPIEYFKQREWFQEEMCLSFSRMGKEDNTREETPRGRMVGGALRVWLRGRRGTKLGARTPRALRAMMKLWLWKGRKARGLEQGK